MPAVSAHLPADEAERIAALHSYQILDTPQETAYDEIVQLAAQICEAPICMISLVDTNRQWFKAKFGWEKEQTSRDIAFAAHTILQQEPLLISNLTRDPLFTRNPLVLNHPNLRFYAGIPLRTAEGKALGSLCVMDHTPRILRFEQQRALITLAHQVVALMDLRRTRVELSHARFEVAMHTALDEVTGLCGREALMRQFVQECQDCKRDRRPLSLLMLEPDRFQAYQDYNGSVGAQTALKAIAQALQSQAMPYELVARADGNGFAMVLPDRDMDSTMRLAGQCRETIARSFPEERPLKVSIGLASRNPGGDPVLFMEAQTALKVAQKTGDSIERFTDARQALARTASMGR